jgi:hypothetical protein
MNTRLWQPCRGEKNVVVVVVAVAAAAGGGGVGVLGLAPCHYNKSRKNG